MTDNLISDEVHSQLRDMYSEHALRLSRNKSKAAIPKTPQRSNVVICKAASGGIPARVTTTVGSATCTIYKDVAGTITATTIEITVKNWATAVVADTGDRYMMASQDRYGTWWVAAEDCLDV